MDTAPGAGEAAEPALGKPARGLAAVRERRVKVAVSVTKANKQDEGAERDAQGNLPR